MEVVHIWHIDCLWCVEDKEGFSSSSRQSHDLSSLIFPERYHKICTGPHSAVGNESDCRSRGREFDPGPVSYFRRV